MSISFQDLAVKLNNSAEINDKKRLLNKNDVDWKKSASGTYLNNASNVGIGTNDPRHKLDVNGDIKSNGKIIAIDRIGIGTTDQNYRLNIDNNDGGYYQFRIQNTGNGAAGLQLVPNTNGIQTNIRTHPSGLFYLQNTNDGIIIQQFNSNDIQLTTTATNGSNTGSIILKGTSGNVGIGNTNPTSKLHVDGDGTFQNIIATDKIGIGTNSPLTTLQLGNNFTLDKGNNDYMGLLGFNRNVQNGNILNSSYSAFQLHNYKGTLSLSVYNPQGNVVSSNALNINKDGNVGIGVTNPNSKLHVDGLTKIDGTLTVDTNIYSHGPNYLVLGAPNNGRLRLMNKNVDTMTLYNGNVGIGQWTPTYPLQVSKNVSSREPFSNSDVPANRWWHWGNNGQTSLTWGSGSSWVNWDANGFNKSVYSAYLQGFAIIQYGMIVQSDKRIKHNIEEIKDNEALIKFRKLKPCKYNYIDKLERGNEKVYGFIAQEVKNVLPYAVEQKSGPMSNIPNIYCLCDVADNTVKLINDSNLYIEDNITFGNSGNTNDLEKNENNEYYKLIFLNIKGEEIIKNIIDIVDNNTIIIDSSFNEEDLLNNQIFLYGQRPDNFSYLNKNAIWTVTTAALQEVDRIQQADAVKIQTLETELTNEKIKVSTLETQLADLLARVTSLENN